MITTNGVEETATLLTVTRIGAAAVALISSSEDTGSREMITMKERVFNQLVHLAWCGVHDGAGSDADMKWILRHARKHNPTYAEHVREAREKRALELKQHKLASKDFVKKYRGEVQWWLDGRLYYDAKILEWVKKGASYGVRVEFQGTKWDPISKASTSAYMGTPGYRLRHGKKAVVPHDKLFKLQPMLAASST